MKKLIFLATLMPWSCTSKPAATGSQVLMTPTASAIPKQGAHVGIYRVPGQKNGDSIAFIPRFEYYRAQIYLRYKKFQFSQDWKEIVTEPDNYTLSFNPGIHENTENVFKVHKQDVYDRVVNLGTLSERTEVRIQTGNCLSLRGVPEFEHDIFEQQIPQVDDDIFILTEIKNLNPLPKLARFVQARRINFKVGAVLTGHDNNRVLLTAQSTQLQDFYILNDHYVNPIGSAVFSAKTKRIIGFVETFSNTKEANLNGTLNLSINSILSQDLLDRDGLKGQVYMLRPKNPIKTSVGKEWKESYCSQNNVAKILEKIIVRENDFKRQQERDRSRNTPPANPNVSAPPWIADRWCLKSPRDILAALEEAVSRQDQAHAAADIAAGQSPAEAQTPSWKDYIPTEHLPEICPREVHAAIAARIEKDKEDKNCRNH